MKKKILIILLVLLVSLSVVFATISCGGKRPPTPNTPPPPPPPVEKEDVGFTEVFDAIKKAADKTVVNVGSVEDKAYFAATIYADIEIGAEKPINYSFTVKGNFSSVVNENEGYILIKDEEANMNLAQVYVAGNSNVYIAELMSQKTATWYKLDQAAGTEFVKEYFTKLPAEISGLLGDLEENVVSNALSAPLISTIGGILMRVNYPQTFSETNTNGDYTLSINMDSINAVMPMLSSLGLNVNTLAETLSGFIGMDLDGATLKSVADVIFPMLLGLKVTVNGNGDITGVAKEGVQPYIAIKASIANSALSAIGLEYTKADDPAKDGNSAIAIRFGVKDVTVSNAVGASLKPSNLNLATAATPDIKLTLNLGMAGKTGLENVSVVGYISPAISWSKEAGFNVSNVKGYASATIPGISEPIAISYDAQDGVLAFDLSGVYKVLDIDIPDEGAVYYNATLSLDELLNGKDEPLTAPANAAGESTNKIDQLVDAILGIFSEGNIMAVVAQAGNAMDLFNLAKGLLEEAINRDTDGIMILDVLDVMEKILAFDVANNNLLSGSEYLTIADHNFTEYLVAEDTLQLIEEAAGWEPGTIGKWVVDISGQDVSSYAGATLTEKVTAFLIDKGLKIKLETFFGPTLDNSGKGLGFKLSLTPDNGTAYAFVELRGTLVQASSTHFGTINYAGGIDLDDDAGWEFFLDQLAAFGDAYLALA